MNSPRGDGNVGLVTIDKNLVNGMRNEFPERGWKLMWSISQSSRIKGYEK